MCFAVTPVDLFALSPLSLTMADDSGSQSVFNSWYSSSDHVIYRQTSGSKDREVTLLWFR